MKKGFTFIFCIFSRILYSHVEKKPTIILVLALQLPIFFKISETHPLHMPLMTHEADRDSIVNYNILYIVKYSNTVYNKPIEF